MVRLLRKLFASKDPYWDRFVNRPPVDPKNLVLDLITASSGGGISAARMDVHDPGAMSGHMVMLAKFWGADIAGVTATDPAWLRAEQANGEDSEHPADAQAAARVFPSTIVCGIRRDFAASAEGLGGRHAEQKLAVVNFNLRSYIREIGFSATFVTPGSAEQVAMAAGLGTVAKDGRFVPRERGREVVLGQVVLTNLPMQPPTEPEDRDR